MKLIVQRQRPIWAAAVLAWCHLSQVVARNIPQDQYAKVKHTASAGTAYKAEKRDVQARANDNPEPTKMANPDSIHMVMPPAYHLM
jgi:hypothetical protein